MEQSNLVNPNYKLFLFKLKSLKKDKLIVHAHGLMITLLTGVYNQM